MEEYDPDRDPPSEEWLALDELERIAFSAEYHQRHRIRHPNAPRHAVVHAIVENQLALGEPVVVATFARLRHEGLDRHDAIHAIGSVFAGQLHSLLTNPKKSQAQPTERYHKGVRRLSAAKWRAS